jgi:hypothetical protein
MSDLESEDFVYEKVDVNFLTELSMLSHFVNLANKRIQSNKKNHIQCEVFLVLKNLINNHLPDLTKKIVSTEKSQKDLDEVFKKHRALMEDAVNKELKKMGEDLLTPSQPTIKEYEEQKKRAREVGLIV